MGVTRFDALRHIVTSGNLAPVAAGLPLFVKAGKRKSYNVAEGQLVFYVIENNLPVTVSAATLTAARANKLFIGVGHVSDKTKGVVDSIRHIGREDLAGCLLEDLSVASPRCGTPNVEDFYFGCVGCGETYTLMVGVDDNRTRSFAPILKRQEYIASTTPDCNSCDDCPQEATCDEIVCDLVDRLNGEVDMGKYPDYKPVQQPELPYRAVKIHDNSQIYCLSPISDDSCENCTTFDAIRTAVFRPDGEGSPAIVVPLVGVTNPGDNTQALRTQLQSVADQINEAFATHIGRHGGNAYITGNSYGTCCPLQLHINSCRRLDLYAESFTVLDEEEAITPSSSYNPFTEHANLTLQGKCYECGTEDTTRSFTCGIRFIAQPLAGDCNCYVEKPLQMYNRKLTITPVGDGWKHQQWKTETVQEMTMPAGFGSWIQYQELRQPVGGEGRNYSWSNNNDGWLNLPDKNSRVNNAVTAVCGKDYCSYNLVSQYPKQLANSARSTGSVYSHVHIPSDDNVTLAAFETFLTALIAFSPDCSPVESVSCSPVLGCEPEE